MFVKTLKHAKLVIQRLLDQMSPGRRWLAIDTETKPKPGFGKGSKDALIIGRADIYIWSLCYMGLLGTSSQTRTMTF